MHFHDNIDDMDPNSITSQLCLALNSDEIDNLPERIPKILVELQSISESEVDEISACLSPAIQKNASKDSPDQQIQSFLTSLGHVVIHLAKWHEKEAFKGPNSTISNLVDAYQSTPESSNFRNQILGLLATLGNDSAIAAWKQLLCTDPPQHRLGIVLAFMPLMQSDYSFDQAFFDELLTKAIGHLPVAAAVLDLANYAFRNKKVSEHPCSSRAKHLSDLLGQLSNQMARVEEGQVPEDFTATQISQSVSDAVALIIPLCDAMGLMNHTDSIGKLNRTLELKHRRLQTEAAAALARMGDENGKNVLLALAEHPNVRIRVLAYAKDLGFEKDISLEYCGEIATAESHLVNWLSDPGQMGIAPSAIELYDSRQLNWPSYEQPAKCFLLKYEYGQQFSNIGISGPVEHAFTADIKHLPLNEIYAAFAGWQTVHQEIFIVPIDRARQAMPGVCANLERQLIDNPSLAVHPLDRIEPIALGGFFGEYQLIVAEKSGHEHGTLILSDNESMWMDAGSSQAPIDWELALDIWRGKRILANFNPSEKYEQ